jgi:hypothetical protein
MIYQSLRMMLIVGLVMSAATAPSAVAAPGGTDTQHHQPGPCEPGCLVSDQG